MNARISVVITGGTKGFGRAMANEFVRHSDNVMVCSRDVERVTRTVISLQKYANVLENSARIEGKVADVTHGLGAVADAADRAFDNRVDAWINCAGINEYGNAHDLNLINLMKIVDINLLGTILGTREALRIMRPNAYGTVFNVLGGGGDGESTPNFAVYGATKAAVDQFSRSVNLEEEHVQIHRVSPGMMKTGLLFAGLDPSSVMHRIARLMARDPEDVARELVPKMRRLVLNSSSSKKKCRWSQGRMIRGRCL